MSYQVPLPSFLQAKLHDNTHPGLALDKYVPSWDPRSANDGDYQKAVQFQAIQKVVDLSADPPAGLQFHEFLERRNRLLSVLKARQFECVTVGPLTLHLSRASALENAGICLHHLYGFAYLPGSGLKGMARAYAETIWLPSKEKTEQKDAWMKIEDVFGWASNPDRKKQINDRNHPAEVRRKDPDKLDSSPINEHTGHIVFHDAWPTEWPRLTNDILSNHHRKYYNGEDAPGDWEDPSPVYFLSVIPGEAFSFALSPRKEDVPSDLVALAETWLLGALCHLGAGAKTNSGYGGFKPVSSPVPALISPAKAIFETEIELVTPGFFAGASQAQEDCDLRPATLRGLLRWWWRTMHAGHVGVETLRKMESMIWGDTKTGGPVRLVVEKQKKMQPIELPVKRLTKNSKGKDVLELNPVFAERNRLPKGIGRRTAPLVYLSYGMDEFAGRPRRRCTRLILSPPASWKIRLVAKNETYLDQAKASLWLLCNYGGAGAKFRKGFGSLQGNFEGIDEAWCLNIAREYRGTEQNGTTHSPSIDDYMTVGIDTPWTNYWYALHKIGEVMESFAQANPQTGHGKHCSEKLSLGLPRKIHGPLDKPLPHQKNDWSPSIELESVKGKRHASPIIIHLSRKTSGDLTIRLTAFPSHFLPDLDKSSSFLQLYLNHMANSLYGFTSSKVKDGRQPIYPSPIGLP